MKRLMTFCFWMLTVLASVSAQNLNPYWTEVKGPNGGDGEVTLTQNGVYYFKSADDYKGVSVFRSVDEGLHWVKLPIQDLDSTSTTSERVYIGASGNFYNILRQGSNIKLYKSSDEGATWTLVNANMVLISQIFESSSGILIGVDYNYIYRSSDQGVSWDHPMVLNNIDIFPNAHFKEILPDFFVISNNPTHSAICAFSSDAGLTWKTNGAKNIIATQTGTIIGYLKQTIYRSSTQGNSWQSTYNLPSVYSISGMLLLPSGRILATTSAEKIWYSDDNGVQWDILPTQTGMLPVRFHDLAPNSANILAYGKGMMIHSTDGGISWAPASGGIHQAKVNHLKVWEDSTMFAQTSDGVWKKEKDSSEWRLMIGNGSALVEDSYRENMSFINPDTFMVMFLSSAPLLTKDGGQTFNSILPDSVKGVYDFFADPVSRRLFCGLIDGLWSSADGGQSWTNILPGRIVRQHATLPSGKILIASETLQVWDPKLQSSVDGGDTWQTIPFSNFIYGPTMLVAGYDGKLYALGHTSPIHTQLAVSEDEGVHWSMTNVEPIENASSIYFYGFSANQLGHFFMFENNKDQLRSTTDQGDSWFMLPNPIQTDPAACKRLFLDADGYLYTNFNDNSLYRSTVSTLFGGYLRGSIRKDGDADCSTPDAQTPLHWPVKIEGENTYFATPNGVGKYTIFVADTGAYQVSVRQPNSIWWDVCDSIQVLHLDTLFAADTADFAGRAVMECPLMQVDVTAPRLRRCFDNAVYVAYCNIGAESADSAWIEIELDPYLTLTSAELSYDSIGPKLFRFNLGSVQPDACGQFQFNVHVDCDSTVIGQTHCITAHAWPDTLCAPVAGWSGANIEAEAHCLGDTVELILRNTGTGISQQLEYIIIEDQIVLDAGGNTYDPGEALEINLPAQGRTWRIESQQEPGHPFSTLAIAFTEGCDGFNSLGFINQFDVNGIRPAWNRFCLQNAGSYDPNDKQGFPLGVGAENRIRPGQDLEYLIRFQNTGTDTAFTVVIRDTLSAWLDPASVRPGAASHPYTWALSGQGVLTVKFDPILLPDSTTNLAASQGFINFHIEQQPNVPLGSKILNTANIYFDFNAPVVTNQTLHTVGLDPVSGVHAPASPTRPAAAVEVAPNPIAEYAVFKMTQGAFHHHRLTLTDAVGRNVGQYQLNGNQFIFERKNLPAGIYAYRIEDDRGQMTGSGKVVME